MSCCNLSSAVSSLILLEVVGCNLCLIEELNQRGCFRAFSNVGMNRLDASEIAVLM